jgi:hypothetical protein
VCVYVFVLSLSLSLSLSPAPAKTIASASLPSPRAGGCQEGQHDEQALQTAQAFKNAILELDATRPISGAWNGDLQSLLNGWGPSVMDIQVRVCVWVCVWVGG